MSDWGPGTPDIDLDEAESGSEQEETEEDRSSDEEEESEEEPISREMKAESDEYQTILHEFERAGDDSPEWRSGSVQDALMKGEYGFLPVFGFNEANVAAQKYHEKHDVEIENGKEDPTLEIGGKELSWWEEDSIIPQHPMVLVNPLGFSYIDTETFDFRETFRFRKGEHFLFSDSGGYQIMTQDSAEVVESREENSFDSYKVNPEYLLEWQVANADSGATLDYPPYNISGDAAFPDAIEHTEEWIDFFEMRQDKSADMTNRMAKHLAYLRDEGDDQAEDYIFCPVLHGKPNPDGSPEKYLRSWHQAMENSAEMAGIKPRGWVLKPEPAANFGQIAFQLGYAAEYLDDADYIHVLMVGGLLQKTLIQFYAMNSDQFVTSDASSYAAGGKRRQFDLPKTATRRAVIISERTGDDRKETIEVRGKRNIPDGIPESEIEEIEPPERNEWGNISEPGKYRYERETIDLSKLDRYPCRCPCCSIVEREKGMKFVTEDSGSAQSVTLNMHNLHQALSVERTFDALMREEDVQIVETDGEPVGSDFWRYVESMGREQRIEDLYRAMDYIRISLEEGFDEANETYRILWDKSAGKTIKRRRTKSASGGDW